MTLDILESLGKSEEELSASAISFVRTAQKKKNALTEKLEKDRQAAYYTLLKNGVLRSSMLQNVYDELQVEYDAAVELVVDELKFQIEFLGGSANAPDDGATQYNYPYNPDYSLDAAGRYYAVYNYYMAMTDPQVRFALFQADTLAPSYLGEFYSTLYDRLQSYAEYS